MHTILSRQEHIEYSGVIIAAPDFQIVVTVRCEAITDNSIIMVIPEFRIDMMVGYQAITIIRIMENKCGMVGIMTIAIPGMVCTTITIL